MFDWSFLFEVLISGTLFILGSWFLLVVFLGDFVSWCCVSVCVCVSFLFETLCILVGFLILGSFFDYLLFWGGHGWSRFGHGSRLLL